MPRRKADERPDISTAHGRLRWARLKAGYGTATAAANAMGVPLGTYGGHENGARAMDDDAAARYGRFFRVRWAWILRGEGAPGASRDWVPVLGYVGAGGAITPFDDHAKGAAMDQIDRPPDVGDQAVALTVRGDSMFPVYRDGDHIVYDQEPATAPDFIGQECVVRLKDGRTYVKILAHGSRVGRFTLMSYNAPPMVDEDVEWAAPIRWVRRGT